MTFTLIIQKRTSVFLKKLFLGKLFCGQGNTSSQAVCCHNSRATLV